MLWLLYTRNWGRIILSVLSQMWSSKTEHSNYFSENEIQFRILRTLWDTVEEGKCIKEKKSFLKVLE